MATRATQTSGVAFFKHKYLTNPSVTPEDLVIAVAENLTRALKISIPQHIQVSTIQALKDILEIFMDAAHKYSNNPTIHMPNVPPTHPHQEPTASPRVPPTPLGTPPPRVHPTTVSPKVPGIVPKCAPSSVQKSLFPPEVSSVGPRQNFAVHRLGTEPRFPTNSKISHIGIPTSAAPISHRIKPHEPFSQLTKLSRSQQIANLGILDNKVDLLDSPARNTRSQTQVQMITQENVLACICNYGEVMGRSIMARHTVLRQHPSNMLHTVLGKTTGHLMDMRHLLVNPKYKELWGKSYPKELICLAQGIPESEKVPTLSFSSNVRTSQMTENTPSRMPESV